MKLLAHAPSDFSLDLRGECSFIDLDLIAKDKILAIQHGLLDYKEISQPDTYHRSHFYYADLEFASDQTRNSIETGLGKEVVFPSLRVCVLKDATITGNGVIITRAGSILRQSVFEWLNFNGTPPNFVRLNDEKFYHIPLYSNYLSGKYLNVKQIPVPVNFGHWLVEGLASVALLKDYILEKKLNLLTQQSNDLLMADTMYASLGMLLPPTENLTIIPRTVDLASKVEELHFLTLTHVPPLKSRQALGKLRSLFNERQTCPAIPNGRYLISRKNANRRRLENEDEISDYLAKYGFSRLCPEALTFSEQLQYFQNSQIIVGAKGANLSLSLFMPEGSHLVALAPEDFPDPFFWDTISGFSINYSEIYGKTLENKKQDRGFKDFVITITQIQKFLNQLGIS